MDFLIEPVSVDYVHDIASLYREAVLLGTASFELDPPDDVQMAHRIGHIMERGYPFVVALCPDRSLLGYAYASEYRSRPAYRWTVENSVYVDSAAHGLGVGSALTAEIAKRCEALGFRQMVAVIGGSDNISSIAMHKKLGFRQVGILQASGFKHGKWLDCVFMQKELGEGMNTDPDADAYPGTLYP
ncbi:MAG: N-acetyltransferase family protein [Pseudomonadota bacterium]